MVSWRLDPTALGAALTGAGYDVDPPDSTLTHPPRIIARRERADETRLVTLDPGGRCKFEITRREEERALPEREVAGLTLRPVAETVRRTVVVVVIDSEGQLGVLLAAIDEIRADPDHRPGSRW